MRPNVGTALPAVRPDTDDGKVRLALADVRTPLDGLTVTVHLDRHVELESRIWHQILLTPRDMAKDGRECENTEQSVHHGTSMVTEA